MLPFLLPTAAAPAASAWSESLLSTYALRHHAAFGTARKHTLLSTMLHVDQPFTWRVTRHIKLNAVS